MLALFLGNFYRKVHVKLVNTEHAHGKREKKNVRLENNIVFSFVTEHPAIYIYISSFDG